MAWDFGCADTFIEAIVKSGKILTLSTREIKNDKENKADSV